MAHIEYRAPDEMLDSALFLDLAQRVWPGTYQAGRVAEALKRTINITAWDGPALVGCVRVLSDGYFFGTIPEILIHPDYRQTGIGRNLMELAWQLSPTGLFFGAQPGNEGFFEKCGFERSLPSFVKQKPRS